MSKFVPPVLRSADSYDTDIVSRDTSSVNTSPSLTKQEFSEEVDINFIVKQFGLTGQLPSNVAVPIEGDFVDALDYQSALNAVIAADRAFSSLDANVRARFNNDPARFMDFCSDGSNYDEAVKLGLAVKRPDLEPDKGSGTVST